MVWYYSTAYDIRNKQIERGITMTKVLHGGFISDYTDFSLWIADCKENAKACIIEKQAGNTFLVTDAKINHIVFEELCDGEPGAYDDACDFVMSDCDVSGEFITSKGVFYVGVIGDDAEIIVSEITYDKCEYC